MRVTRRVAVLLMGSMHLLLQAEVLDLEACLTRAIPNKVYQAPTPAEWIRAKELFQRTLQGGWTDADLTNAWAELGLDLQAVGMKGETLWLLSEPAGHAGGRGWYLFRTNQESSMALEAPHAQNDVYTGMIGLRLFLAGQTRVFAAGTITRHRADVAHLDDTFFQAFTLAFAQACPTGMVIQLHGFDPRNHPDASAEIIASAGTHSPEPWLTDLVRRIKRTARLSALAYPHDTGELGATLNAQGRALRQTGRCGFLHLEMSRSLRERLIRDNELHRTLLACVSATDNR